MSAVIFESVHPVITVRDVRAALRRYEQLGFDTEHDERADYGLVERGSVQIHLQPGEADETGGVLYLRVSDAQALHSEWTAAGVEGRFLGPHNTPYGLREFVYTDPDGVVHKVGSRLKG
jgi:hypothetical protein